MIAGLFRWRDGVCRELDESTGSVLPRKLLAKLAREMPANQKALQKAAGSTTSLISTRHQEVGPSTL